MAIFATPLGKLSSVIVVPQDAEDGALLVYDAENGVFVAENVSTSATPITDAQSLGLPTGIPLISSVGGGTLYLRSLVAGPGIELTEDTDTVTISRVLDSPSVSNTDYVVVIDANGDEPGAEFRIERGTLPASSSWTPAPPPPFTVDDVFVDNDTVLSRGYLETRDGLDFTTTGLSNIDIVRVTNTQVEDGDRFVADVWTVAGTPTVSRIEFEQLWPNDNLGGPRDGIVVEPAPCYVEAGTPSPSHDPARLYILRVYGADFSPSGLNWQPGWIVRITGSENGVIDGTYTIWQVEAPDALRPHPSKWSALIFDPNTPLPASISAGTVLADPTGGPILIELVGTTVTTGFVVKDDGRVSATSVTVTDIAPVNPGDLTSKSYVDGVVSNLVDTATHAADIAALDARITANETAIADLRRRLRSTYRYWLTDLF